VHAHRALSFSPPHRPRRIAIHGTNADVCRRSQILQATGVSVLIHPLIFRPLYKHRIWGGRRIVEFLDRTVPAELADEPRIGESWELVDLEDDASPVALGPAAGRRLPDLVKEWGPGLMGRVGLVDGRFPLLIKYLDAREPLSVQVHPDEACARRLGGNVRVKHEAWYILDAAPGATIYHGLRPGVTADAFRAAMLDGSIDQVLRRVNVRVGDCFYLPSACGVLVAEVQTPSDITYRTYDWGRVDPSTGKPRALHLDEAIACIDFDTPPSEPSQPRTHVASLWTAVTSLVRCESFVIERVRMVEGIEQQIPYAEPVVWIVLEGAGELNWRSGAAPIPFRRGDVVLLPAGVSGTTVRITAAAQWLEVTVPVPSDLAGFERPPGEDIAPDAPQKLVQIGLPRR
jgi:mannose-6-phosphate isomerase